MGQKAGVGTEVSKGSQKRGAAHGLQHRSQQMVNFCKILRESKAEMKAEIWAQGGSRVEAGEAHSQVKNEQGRERAGKETNLNISTDGHLSTSVLHLPPQASYEPRTWTLLTPCYSRRNQC